jgi:hypothetical protein
MATTVGQIVLDVDADGRLLERRVRQIGKRGGVTAGKSFTKEFDEQLSGLTKSFRNKVMAQSEADAGEGGKKAGVSFSDAFGDSVRRRLNKITNNLVEALQTKGSFQKFVDEAGGTQQALEKLNGQLVELRKNNILNGAEVGRINAVTRSWSKSLDENTAAHRALSTELEEHNKVVALAQEEYNESIRLQKDYERTTLALATAEERRAILLDRQREAEDRLNKSKDGSIVRNVRLEEISLRLKTAIGGFTKESEKANKSSKSFFSRWKVLPRGFRRLAFFTALFASIAEQIAVLGSAAGSSLAVLAGSTQKLLSATAAGAVIALGSLVVAGVGIGVIATAFRGFTGELSELPPNARAAAVEFRKFGESLGEVRKIVQERFFDGIAEPLGKFFTDLTPILGDGLGAVADELNLVFQDLISRLSSPEGLGNFEKILQIITDASGPLFTAFINFGSGLAEVFIISGPSIQRFSEYLERITEDFESFTQSEEGREKIQKWLEDGELLLENFLEGVQDVSRALGNIFKAGEPQITRFNKFLGESVDQFADFTGSLEGQNALETWFKNGERVVLALMPLVESLGGMLNRLVDEEAIQNIEDAFSNLTLATPGLESLLDTLGQLDIFGLITDIFLGLMTSLKPVFDILAPIASIISNILGALINSGGLSVALTVALAPLLGIFTVIDTIVSQLTENFAPLNDIMNEVIALVNEQLTSSFRDVGVAIGNVILAVFGLDGNMDTLVADLRTNLVPFVRDQVVPKIKEMSDKFVEVADAVRLKLIPWIRDVLVPFIKNDLLPALGRAGDAFNTWRDRINNVRDALSPVLDLIGRVGRAIGLLPNIPGVAASFPSQRPRDRAATGGIVTQRTIAGEAGPELIIPLTRPLSQVDPSVRELAGIAQGMYGNAGRMGGPTRGGQPGVFIAPGAINVISPFANPANVAMAALDELVEMIG